MIEVLNQLKSRNFLIYHQLQGNSSFELFDSYKRIRLNRASLECEDVTKYNDSYGSSKLSSVLSYALILNKLEKVSSL